MDKTSVGKRLYISVLAVFLLFAAAFIIFQQAREKQFKIDTLNLKLQDYNVRMYDALHYIGRHDEAALDGYFRTHHMPDLRVTLIDRRGRVFFDSQRKDYANIRSHANRQEVRQALKAGTGSTVERSSRTLKGDFFYYATYFPKDKYIIRSALPYNNDLAKSLQTDQHFIWFAITAIIILTIVLYRFISRLGSNIMKLKMFASRADHNESLEVEDLIDFPDDELGEIAERIIKLYKRVQNTRMEQDKLKRQLTQNVAHELKTPVASIQGYLETILNNPRIDNDTKQQFLQRCYAQSERLASLLHDISTLNRMDDATDMMSFEKINISDMVDNIQKETVLQLKERAMTFKSSMPDGITINGNRSLLYSVFRNLTDNAIAYAGEGTIISLTANEDDEHWFFSFSDNGVGVAQEHIARLFERFYRVDKGRSRKMGGTGLGLAIVKNAVLIHGGSITVENNDDGGLRFDFSLRK